MCLWCKVEGWRYLDRNTNISCILNTLCVHDLPAWLLLVSTASFLPQFPTSNFGLHTTKLLLLLWRPRSPHLLALIQAVPSIWNVLSITKLPHLLTFQTWPIPTLPWFHPPSSGNTFRSLTCSPHLGVSLSLPVAICYKSSISVWPLISGQKVCSLSLYYQYLAQFLSHRLHSETNEQSRLEKKGE